MNVYISPFGSARGSLRNIYRRLYFDLTQYPRSRNPFFFNKNIILYKTKNQLQIIVTGFLLLFITLTATKL